MVILPPPVSGDNTDGPPSTDNHGAAEMAIPPEVIHGQVRGSRVGNSVFTAENILEIRGRVGAGESQRHVAKEFGLDTSYMSRIIQRKAWGWLPKRDPTPAERAKAEAYIAAMKIRKPGRAVMPRG